MLIVFPLLSYSERLLLVVNQESNIAMYNVVDMLKNPLSWVVLLFMGILMSIFTAVEQIGILRILNASVFNIKADAKQTFADTANIIIEPVVKRRLHGKYGDCKNRRAAGGHCKKKSADKFMGQGQKHNFLQIKNLRRRSELSGSHKQCGIFNILIALCLHSENFLIL